MREVNDQLEGLVTERLEREDDVVDQEVAVRLADFVAARDVVKDRIAGARCAGLKNMLRQLYLKSGLDSSIVFPVWERSKRDIFIIWNLENNYCLNYSEMFRIE